MKVSDFNYNLPKELIAQVPIKNIRDMMVNGDYLKGLTHIIKKDK